ncbi:uncharacterized protein HD556DRAFT_30025 [Suillus plorans]|uniref:DUF6533 domain-containing protein n=1 Tax=Suillus plorans TaxID=116603 RepID=A0A9P7J9W6_9AGAM|nr:uncharacterized protein HD556DRAFT_30025 [Suillus plorans]KAG1810139.1 hypothetical protein HD556DRAFT_30025 [Suillus plorans]
MTLVSNDSAWWPFMLSTQMTSYVVAAFSFGLMYDWALTFGREVELVWRQRWSFMTVLYLGVRCAGISHAIINIQLSLPRTSVTDSVSRTMFDALCWLNVAVTAMLGVIMIARIIFLAVNITDGVITAMVTSRVSSEVFILFGIAQCASDFQEGSDNLLLALMTWILPAVWEVLALCLAIRIAFKRLRELQRPLTGWLDVRDCFAVLTKTHVIYFASFVVVSGFILPYALLTAIADTVVTEHQIYFGLAQTFIVTVMCVLGPRLILGVREYHAKLVADSERGPGMTSIAFEERVHVSTGISV